jgi:hypothetical protein
MAGEGAMMNMAGLGAGALTGGVGWTPMLLKSLFAMAPGLLSKLFGGDPAKEQDKKMQQLREQIMQLLSPQHGAALVNQLYQQNLQSPGYSQAQGSIASGANATQGNLNAALGARGLGTTGTGAVLSGLMPSIVGQQKAGLQTSAYQSAQQQAQQQIQQQIEALQGTTRGYGQAAGPSQSSQYFATGINSLTPVLNQWLQSKYPSLFKAA